MNNHICPKCLQTNEYCLCPGTAATGLKGEIKAGRYSPVGYVSVPVELVEAVRLLLCKINKVTAPHRHGNKIHLSDLDRLSNYQIEVEAALSALDGKEENDERF